MTERRQHYRAISSNPIELVHDGRTFEGRLENVSLSGALVRMEQKAELHPAALCLLRIRAGGDTGTADCLQLRSEVVHTDAQLIGLRFLDSDGDTQASLPPLVKLVQEARERCDDDVERVRAHLAAYCSTRQGVIPR